MLHLRLDRRDYAVAVLAVIAALLLRAIMDPVLGDQLPFYAFYFSVMAAAAWAGAVPALLSLTISFFCATYLFVAPRYSLTFTDESTLLNAFRFITLGSAIALVGGWMRVQHARWRSEMTERKIREAEAVRRMEESVSALASLGDGLITVDPNGRVTFMNRMAEELCGWSLAEAKGRSVEAVFQLLQPHEDVQLESPALRALQEQQVITVPRGTRLVTRSGTVCPIDDSAAPIRDASGIITGAVIVFRGIDNAEENAFTVLNIQLHPVDGSQLPLNRSEEKNLERACRKWLEREWRMDRRAVRMVALNGFDLIVRQESAELQKDGPSEVRFIVSYQR